MRIRKVKTASGKYALQVVSKKHGRLTVHKHIGSYATSTEQEAVEKKAHEYINAATGQLSLIDQIFRKREGFVIVVFEKVFP